MRWFSRRPNITHYGMCCRFSNKMRRCLRQDLAKDVHPRRKPFSDMSISSSRPCPSPPLLRNYYVHSLARCEMVWRVTGGQGHWLCDEEYPVRAYQSKKQHITEDSKFIDLRSSYVDPMLLLRQRNRRMLR